MSDKQFIGRFYWLVDTTLKTDDNLDPKQRARLSDIASYYTDEIIESILIPIISKSETGGRLSLRALDWLVTNYAKKKPVVYKIAPPHHPIIPVNIHNDYKSWLNNHKRRNFDMFRRRKRIYFEFRDQTFETTVGQLNFFFWAARYGIIDYAKTNIVEIEADHAISTKRHAEEANALTNDVPVVETEMPVVEAEMPIVETVMPVVGVVKQANVTPSNKLVKKVKVNKTILKKRVYGKNVNGIIVRRRRRELSRAPHSKCFVYSMAIDVVFDKET